MADGEGAEEVNQLLPVRARPVREVGGEVRGDEGELVLLEVPILPALAHPVNHDGQRSLQRDSLLVKVDDLPTLALGSTNHSFRHTLAIDDATDGQLLELHDVLSERARLVGEDILDLAEAGGQERIS